MGYRRWGSWVSIGALTLLGVGAMVISVAAGSATRPLQARPAGTVAAASGTEAGIGQVAAPATSASPPSTTTTAAVAVASAGTAGAVPPFVPPAPVPGTGSVDGRSCLSASFCMAVGSLEGGPGGTEALLEAWDGSSWSVLPSPPVDGGTWNSLNGVSCPSPSFCVAVGSAQETPDALVESWDGTSWSVVPSPPVGTAVLSAVACSSASFCAAVGDTEGGPGGTEAVTELWDGTAWTAPAAPLVGGGRWNSLSAVTCSAATSCSATGTYQSDQGDAALAESWDGTSWSVLTPAG